MKEVFESFPKRYEPGEMPWHCEICSKPCSELGYVVISAAADLRYCRCCIEMLVIAAPDIALAALHKFVNQLKEKTNV